jgi:hypothetical protein
MAVAVRTRLVQGEPFYAIAVGIASGQSVSDSVDIFGLDVDAIRFPAAWDASSLAFDESPDVDPAGAPVYGWAPVYDDGGGDVPAEMRLKVATGISMRLNGVLAPYRWVRFRSVDAAAAETAAASAVPQTAARQLVLLARGL